MSGLGEWDDDPADPNVNTGAGDLDDDAPPLYFASVDEFVREMIVPVFRRRTGDRNASRWAADWWRYPEAVIRLEALWRSWEHLRLDPALGMSIWLRDHADYHLGILFSEDGPFGRSEDASSHGDALPYERPPVGLFPGFGD